MRSERSYELGPLTELVLRYALPGAVLIFCVLSHFAEAWQSVLMGLALCLAVLVTAHTLTSKIRRISLRKSELDIQLIQSQKMAAIGVLSSGVAHEINTPLAIISQEAELIQHAFGRGVLEGLKEAPEIKDSVAQIVLQVDHCREITHKLLSFARKREAISQETNINGLIEDMVQLVEREAKLNNIRINRKYAQGLPPVVTDPSLLRQVVLNLLNNAVQAIQDGGEVTASTGLEGQNIAVMKFTDTGCGISKDDLANIFNPFFTTKPPGKGTGLGLSICLTILERLGGTVSVQSEPGKGTTFAVRLPVGRRVGQ
ncbi:MAG: ATP-binding protein [Desulfovibrionaceae bacterium]|nr:two-component sensor histidine kinase [Desulfovibrionaceae bacterium]MDD4951504.1 ATP-binding protein [Desulfovibrionaceae bacterium]